LRAQRRRVGNLPTLLPPCLCRLPTLANPRVGKLRILERKNRGDTPHPGCAPTDQNVRHFGGGSRLSCLRSKPLSSTHPARFPPRHWQRARPLYSAPPCMVPERPCAPTIFCKSIQAPTAGFEQAISGLCYGQRRQVSRRLIEPRPASNAAHAGEQPV
jgi:hypothetical protein